MDYSGVDAARQNAQTTAQTALDYSVKGNTLADELKKAIGERYGQSGIAADTAKARTDFMAAAPQARQDVLGMVQSGTLLSPTQQRAILAAKRSSALMPLMEQNLVNDAAFGTIEDLINAGTNAWNAKSTAAQGAAQIAQTGYSSLLNELLQKAQEDRAAQTQEWNKQLQPYRLEKLKADIAATRRSNQGGAAGGEGNDQNVEAWANLVLENPDLITQIPTKIVGQVYKRRQELSNEQKQVNEKNAQLEAEEAKKNDWWGKGVNWLGNQVKGAWDYLGRPDVPPISMRQF